MRFSCDSQTLEVYGEFIKKFCIDQRNKYLALKRKCENVDWNDSVFMQFADDMDRVGGEIIDALDYLSDGVKVYLLSDLSPLVNDYLKSADNFPLK